MFKIKRKFCYLLILAMALLLSACAGVWADAKQYRQSGQMLRQRDFAELVKVTEKKKNKIYKRKDRVIKNLDLGMLYHYQGDYIKSNQFLEKAEQQIDELYTKSVSKAAFSMLLNDNVLEYHGEDYEDIYTNVFKALNYLHLSDFDAAFVEIRRINMKLDLLEDKYDKLTKGYNSSKKKKAEFTAGKNQFYSSALGRYLSMIIYQQEGKIDDAYIDYVKLQEAFDTQPAIYNFDLPPLTNPHEKGDSATLHVVSMIGRAPRKASKELNIATGKDRITIVGIDETIMPYSFYWPGIDSNTFIKFVMPYMVNEVSEVGRVEVVVDSLRYDLAMLEDIGNVAVQTFKVKEPILLLKNVTRTLAKSIANKAIKDQIKEDNKGFARSLLNIGTDIAFYLSEQADLRNSRFFPGSVLVADIPIPAGEHSVTINYYDHFGNMLFSDNKGLVNANTTKLNLIESWQLQ